MDIKELYQIFCRCNGVTTDSRNCPQGSLFVALRGETFDGNAFAAETLKKGCAYAIIDNIDYQQQGDERLIVVENCLQTLQQLARLHRRTLGTPVIGVTGTNGKTTTKELISAVLVQKYRTLFTQGNHNNHIGVPLTLLRLTREDEMAVVEMGANHPGEICTLVNIAEPDYGIITNVGRAHLEGFGSFEGVIHTKGELYDFLRTRPGSVVFIDNDNEHLKGIAQGLTLERYGFPCDTEPLPHVCGRVTGCDPYLQFEWSVDGAPYRVKTHLVGSYNIKNALAAIAIGHYFGVPDCDINRALTDYVPSNNRSQLKESGSNRLLIDAYNANPTSMMAALANFREMRAGCKMVILGDMKELGAESLAEHKKIVEYLRESHFDKVWLVGAQFTAAACGDSAIRTFADVEEVKALLAGEKPTESLILIKGSNSMKLAQLADII